MTTAARTEPGLARALIAQWESRGDLDYIRRDLARRNKDRSRLTLVDLASYDQLHAGQLRASRDFVEWVGVDSGARVLELGAGLGGTARLLAVERDCRVVAVELSQALHDAGVELTGWLELAPRVTHLCGDLLADQPPDRFDLVWLQHVDMHVSHKDALYARAARGLADHGRVVWHDWLSGSRGAPHYPVPWSDDGQLSFLSGTETFTQNLRRAGLELSRFQDLTERTHTWFSSTLAGLTHALSRLPDDAARRRARFSSLATRVEQVLRNLDEQRLLPFYGEATASPSGHRPA